MTTPQWKKNLIHKLSSTELIRYLSVSSTWQAYLNAVDSNNFDSKLIINFGLDYSDGMVMQSLRRALSYESFKKIQDKVSVVLTLAQNEDRIKQQRQND